MNDYGRYKRTRQSPQVAEVLKMPQPAKTMEHTPIIHFDNVVQQSSKDTGSESESETWSFDRAINEVFRLFHRSYVVSNNNIISAPTIKTNGKYHKVYTEQNRL